MAKELTKQVIEDFIYQTNGIFNVRDLWNEKGIMSQEGKATLRTILNRLKNDGVIAPLKKDGEWRLVDKVVEKIDWQSADPRNEVKLKFPFELENFVKIYPHSIILLAGDKGVGKTSFVNNFIVKNMSNFKIDLFCNQETSAEQLHERFQHLHIPNPSPFDVYERYENYADVIIPGHLSIIDYLVVEGEFFYAGREISEIMKKIGNGIGFIVMQKPPDQISTYKGQRNIIERDLAYGGASTAWRAQLYLVMRDTESVRRLKIKYSKVPRNSAVKPDGMQWQFDIDSATGDFENIRRYYEGVHIEQPQQKKTYEF